MDLDASTRLVAALQSRWGARLLQTHISWVLLAGEHAWKIKKPVTLPFLDFATLAERRRLCEEELRLNRRLAPEWYLDVLPIGGTPEDPRPGEAPAIEYALRMRRFPHGALFSERLAAGTLRAAHVQRLALRLARLHGQAPAAPTASGWGSAAHVAGELRAVAAALPAWQPWAEATVAAFGPEWQARADGGHVREGHGDLHLANLIAVGDDATAFDALEFDPGLRWIDVASDIGFAFMDFHAWGRADFAHALLDRWLEETGDHGALAVLRPYVVYRALVRAMVSGLRAPVAGTPGAAEYQAVASQWSAPPQLRLVLMHGLSGSGKSRLAAALLAGLGAVRLRSDVERKRLFGIAPRTRVAAEPGQGVYGPGDGVRTYARLLALARDALAAGWPVVVDAAFLRRAERAPFAALAQSMGLPCTLLHCQAPADLLRQRLAARHDDPSDADAAVLPLQQAAQEVPSADEGLQVLVVDSTLPAAADEVLAALGPLAAASRAPP